MIVLVILIAIVIIIIISSFFTLLTTSFLLEKHTVIKDINLLFSIHVLELIKNLKKAENCFIAGGAKKTDMEVIGGNKV